MHKTLNKYRGLFIRQNAINMVTLMLFYAFKLDSKKVTKFISWLSRLLLQ